MAQQLQHSLAHPIWGLPLDTYLAYTKIQTPVNLRHPHEISNSLDVLRTGKATCEDLEICLSLVNNQIELQSIMRQDLLTGCMTALRQYCSENPVSIKGHILSMIIELIGISKIA